MFRVRGGLLPVVKIVNDAPPTQGGVPRERPAARANGLERLCFDTDLFCSEPPPSSFSSSVSSWV